MTYWQKRGRRVLAELQADPPHKAQYVETADIGCLILALLERIQRLEESQRGQGQEQQSE